ncbi:hypothetical protein SD81_017190 [Tolypothrix campylonemoides VB511288]|nr:hypothetical protein SD81_017190 [Tolypothrix campylonemoides VB511288]
MKSCLEYILLQFVNLTVDDATTDAALNRFKTQAVDGYDLLMKEAIIDTPTAMKISLRSSSQKAVGF